jgi:hypothetical protein
MIQEKLAEIQKKLKAPKGQMNKFGGYKYRSCEDILEAVKPLLGDLILTISDEVVLIGNRYYVKALVILAGDGMVSTQAFAREEEIKKGMDASQITGAASSYARKYALNGMFAIDDTKDADSTNTHDSTPKEAAKPATPTPTIPPTPKADPVASGTVTEAQIKRLFTLANNSDKSKSDIKWWLKFRGMESSKELTPDKYDELVKWIEKPMNPHSPCPDGSVDYPVGYCDGCPRDIECERKV